MRSKRENPDRLMENFVVSARKYRPATFDTVVGQASITNTLKNAIKNNHLAQAFLFCGPRGVGKTTCARIMAKTINCENLSENIEACNECPSCVSFNNSASFNVHELDAASNNSVDDIRSLVDQVRIPPQMGRYKVYIIDEVHMLSTSAFNAFLKTLEEPPAYAKFILATTEKHKIIPTILSRCQIFDFSRITIEDIAKHLQYVAANEGITANYDALHIIAQKADGALRDALSIFDQIVSFAGTNITYEAVIENLNVLDYDYYFRITNHILQADISQTLLLINEILEKGFEGAHFITGFGEHLRNLLVCKDPQTVKLIEVGDHIRQKYLDQAQKCSVAFLLNALEINTKCDLSYKNSSNKRLQIELSLLQMSGLQNAAASPQGNPVAIPAAQPVSTIRPVTPPTPAAPVPTSASPTPIPTVPPSATSQADTPLATNAETPTPAPRPPISAMPKGLSLKINQSPQEEEKKKPELDSSEMAGERPETYFSQSDLQEVWTKMAGQYKDQHIGLFVALTTHGPELKPGHVIEVRVDNIIQQDNINERKPELLSQIRKHLNNYAITLVPKVVEVQQVSKAYLPAEKFQKMVEKNPNIEKLKNDLDLDLIY